MKDRDLTISNVRFYCKEDGKNIYEITFTGFFNTGEVSELFKKEVRIE